VLVPVLLTKTKTPSVKSYIIKRNYNNKNNFILLLILLYIIITYYYYYNYNV